jgi:hypothetical protein
MEAEGTRNARQQTAKNRGRFGDEPGFFGPVLCVNLESVMSKKSSTFRQRVLKEITLAVSRIDHPLLG